MHGYTRKRGWLSAALLALALLAALPEVAFAKPQPGARPRGFRLFARSLGAMVVNRVYCGLFAPKGQICVDSLGSSTIGGGFWPKGSAQQYVFNSGLQIAGKINNPGGAWHGDVTGAFLFDPKGTTEHGDEVQPIFNTQNPDDFANWPDVALVPEDPRVLQDEEIFFQTLIGRRNASQGDVHFMTWDGNPTLTAGRPHPLGVMVEQRGMGWNYPAGNQDIIYFVFTFYNVTSRDAASYASARPEIQPLLLQLGTEFQTRNEATFGISLPDGGYTIDSLFAGFAADMDVTNSAGTNFCSVNLPFALGFCWEHTFLQTDPGPYDPTIFGPPFFAGSGFVGVKYLRGPGGPGAIQLFSNTINSATGFRDPQNVGALFRYLSGNISAAAGDQPCNNGNQLVTRICFINPTAADARFYQSSPALTLAPGDYQSIVVGYIFAAPVAIPGFSPTGATDIRPGDPRRLTDPVALPSGANFVDSLAGFRGWSETDGDLIVEQNEFRFVTGSLLGKARVAQDVYDAQFLLPFAPESPDFFLVPGNNQVTVLWRQSPTETSGDPFFAVASDPGTPGNANSLYDPNYRQRDVEGYRIYRSRIDSPDQMTLLIQYDYAGTVIKDYTGQVNPSAECAPELGVTASCPVAFNFTPGSGMAATQFVEYPLVGDVLQVPLGPAGRAELADGTLINLAADTAVVGGPSGRFPALQDTGIPFGFVDRDVRNNFRYFYSVTSFDVNSFQSGPSSIESARVTKSVTPVPDASNTEFAEYTTQVIDPNNNVYTVGPAVTIDANNGTFSGRLPAVAVNQLVGVIDPFAAPLARILSGSDFTARLDSVRTRADGEAFPADSINAFNCLGLQNGQGLCWEYFFTFVLAGQDSTKTKSVLNQPILTPTFGDPLSRTGRTNPGGLRVDPQQAADYGFPAQLAMPALVEVTAGQHGEYSAGENFNGRRAFASISVGGSRWFSGPNETQADPTTGIGVGTLPGVTRIFSPMSHIDADPATAGVQALGAAVCMQVFNYGISPFGRQADLEVTWGAGGTITSVRDVTHNLTVPFKRTPQASWGFVPDANANGRIDWMDLAYVEDMVQTHRHVSFCDPSFVGQTPTLQTTLPASGAGAFLTQTAVVSPTSTQAPGNANPGSVTTNTGQGFGLYIAGHYHIFELTGGVLPAAGTVWTLRGYAGRVRAATAEASADPSGYTFEQRVASPMLPGIRVRYIVTERTATRAVTKQDLERVHTVPDPYYVTNDFEVTTESKVIKFVNLPTQAIIRLYTASGVLVDIIEHSSTQFGGSAEWNLRNRNNQVVASGVYFYHIESGGARRVGRMTVVNFAQ